MSSTSSELNDYFKFQLGQDNDKYVIQHPSPMTKSANLLLELEKEQVNGNKNWLIPVDKEFLVKKIPYFKALFNTNNFWKETKNCDKIDDVSKILVKKPGNVDNNTIFKLLKMLHAQSIYDRGDAKFKTDNFIDRGNVLKFFELSEFWMVDDCKNAAIRYATENMDSYIMMKAYNHDNPLVRKEMEPVCKRFINKKEESAKFYEKYYELSEKTNSMKYKVRCDLHSAIGDCETLYQTKTADKLKLFLMVVKHLDSASEKLK